MLLPLFYFTATLIGALNLIFRFGNGLDYKLFPTTILLKFGPFKTLLDDETESDRKAVNENDGGRLFVCFVTIALHCLKFEAHVALETTPRIQKIDLRRTL